MDTVKQSRKDPLHTIAGNVEMCFGVALNVGAWVFTEKRQQAELTYGYHSQIIPVRCFSVMSLGVLEAVAGAIVDIRTISTVA